MTLASFVSPPGGLTKVIVTFTDQEKVTLFTEDYLCLGFAGLRVAGALVLIDLPPPFPPLRRNFFPRPKRGGPRRISLLGIRRAMLM